MNLDPIYSTLPIEKDKLVELLGFTNHVYAIEVGAFRGLTTVALAKQCRLLSKRLIVIDPWEGQDITHSEIYEDFLDNTQSYRDVLTVIKQPSDKCLDYIPKDLAGNCSLIFIDGRHDYPYCLGDMKRFWQLLGKGGLLAIHDTYNQGWPGVRQALEEFIAELPPATYKGDLVYYPTSQEQQSYGYGGNLSGLSWIQKD